MEAEPPRHVKEEPEPLETKNMLLKLASVCSRPEGDENIFTPIKRLPEVVRYMRVQRMHLRYIPHMSNLFPFTNLIIKIEPKTKREPSKASKSTVFELTVWRAEVIYWSKRKLVDAWNEKCWLTEMLHTVRTIIGGLIIATLKVISWLKFYCNECAFTDTHMHEVSSDKNQIFIESFKLYYIIAARLNMSSIPNSNFSASWYIN